MKTEFDEHKAKGAACLLKQPVKPFVQGAKWEFNKNVARDTQLSKEFKTLERALGLIQQKIARSALNNEQQKVLIEGIDAAITRFEKTLLSVSEAKEKYVNGVLITHYEEAKGK